jgi:hypothetical protein
MTSLLILSIAILSPMQTYSSVISAATPLLGAGLVPLHVVACIWVLLRLIPLHSHGPLSHLAHAGCRVSLCFWLLAFLPCTTSIKPVILLLPRHCMPPRSAIDFLSTTHAPYFSVYFVMYLKNTNNHLANYHVPGTRLLLVNDFLLNHSSLILHHSAR